MVSIGKITYKGKSGKEYKFNIYDLKSSWTEDAVVYLVTRAEKKPDGGTTHHLIYIGQTDNLKTQFAYHNKQSCFDKNNANRLCLIMEGNEKTRTSIESDLLANRKTPCND